MNVSWLVWLLLFLFFYFKVKNREHISPLRAAQLFTIFLRSPHPSTLPRSSAITSTINRINSIVRRSFRSSQRWLCCGCGLNQCHAISERAGSIQDCRPRFRRWRGIDRMIKTSSWQCVPRSHVKHQRDPHANRSRLSQFTWGSRTCSIP
jgi:hypothetical protein